jgi:hypothetical protein
MFEFMGVRVDPVDEPVTASMVRLSGPIAPAGRVGATAATYSFDGRQNDSFRAANLLFDKGASLQRVDKPGGGLRPGDFIVSGAAPELLAIIAKQTGADFAPTAGARDGVHEAKRMRTAMYQRYRGGNMDEGWTRLLLEQFSFPYTSIFDAEIKKGDLDARYDVIILPDDSTAAITGERPPAGPGGRGGGERPSRRDEEIPPEYRSGIGADGVKSLQSFVQKGGTLVTLGSAASFAIERFELNVRNVTANRNPKEFWCPGSTLRVKFSNTHPLAYGMPAEGLGLFFGSPAFEIVPGARNEEYETVARYADRDLLESGWLIGEHVLAKKAAVVSARMGKGRVLLIGLRAQHRAQTHGTFKLLFNALIP